MISVANRWQSEIRKPADGTQPSISGFGTTITASGSTHTKGLWTDVVVAGDWAGFTGDAFEIEINFNNANAGAATTKVLADIGIDTGGGYASIIDNLGAHDANNWTTAGLGIGYRFPLRIPNGAKVGCRIQSNVASQTISVSIILRGNPSHPGLVRAGTFVRTLGADTSTSGGTTLTAGTGSDGAWTAIATTADDLWYWEVGYSNGDTSITNGALWIDLATGAPSSEVAFARGFLFGKSATETIGKPPGQGVVWAVASGAAISAREQTANTESGEQVIVYAVGGSHELSDAAIATGTLTLDGSPVAGVEVTIFAVDGDDIAELIASDTTDGAGGFSIGVPDVSRSYFASTYFLVGPTPYPGRSISGTPGTDDLDITLFSGGGGAGSGYSRGRIVNG